jgi:hypothetical protein
VLVVAAPFFWATSYLKQEERWHSSLNSLVEALPPSEYFIAQAELKHGDSISPERRQLVERYDAAKKESNRLVGEFVTYERFQQIGSAVAVTMFVGGLVLAAVGFQLWYVRIQRPLDCVLVPPIAPALLRQYTRSKSLGLPEAQVAFR